MIIVRIFIKTNFKVVNFFITVCVGHLFSVYIALQKTTTNNFIQFIDSMFFGHEKSISSLFSSYLFVTLGFYFQEIGKIYQTAN